MTSRAKPGEALHDELLDFLLDGDGNAFAVHVVISASVCNSLGGSMLWMVASTGTAGLAVGNELEAGGAMIEGGLSAPPPLPGGRWVSDREMVFCRRRNHPRKHASNHSNAMPAAGLTMAGESRTSTYMLLPSPSPDSGGGGNGNSSGGRGCGGGNREGRSVAEGGDIGVC